ncbi:hypothetical protein F4781DRAFT_433466 [Annulohypoxylon bovei var. microspora]|nr:hypothetical protein F4781DRAFT_433466 [Annulohypoxylon bovei var. microspora]
MPSQGKSSASKGHSGTRGQKTKSSDQGRTIQRVSSSTTGSSSQYYTDSSQRPNTMTGKAPGKRCLYCRSRGLEQWVFSGRDCGLCGTYMD